MAGPIAADGTTGTDESRLTAFVKAYDVRGLVGSQLTPQVTRAIGYAFARFLSPDASAVVVAYDMRESSPELAGAFAEGVTTAGLDVVMAGLGSTDMLYFAAGHLNLPGVDIYGYDEVYLDDTDNTTKPLIPDNMVVMIPSTAVSRVLGICDAACALPTSTGLPAALSMLRNQPRPIQLVNLPR